MTDRFLRARQRRLLRGTVRGTTGKFRNFGDEDLILVAPVDKDLVFSHDYLRLGLAATEPHTNGPLSAGARSRPLLAGGERGSPVSRSLEYRRLHPDRTCERSCIGPPDSSRGRRE